MWSGPLPVLSKTNVNVRKVRPLPSVEAIGAIEAGATGSRSGSSVVASTPPDARTEPPTAIAPTQAASTNRRLYDRSIPHRTVPGIPPVSIVRIQPVRPEAAGRLRYYLRRPR